MALEKTIEIPTASGVHVLPPLTGDGTESNPISLKCGPGVTVNDGKLSLVKTVTPADKAKYYADNLAKAKAGTYTGHEITADYEPLPGWTPFKDTGKTTPEEMVAALARTWDTNDGDYNAIIPGDYFNVSLYGAPYEYVCNGRDQYYIAGDSHNSKHHYVFVPNETIPPALPYYEDELGLGDYSNNWESSYINIALNGSFLRDLAQTIKDSIVELDIPYTDNSGSRYKSLVSVFVPSEIEAFGRKRYSAESIGGTPPNKPFIPLSLNNVNRMKGGGYWLRSAKASTDDNAVVCTSVGTVNYSPVNYSDFNPLPCFNFG